MNNYLKDGLEWDDRMKRFTSNGLVWSATRTESFIVASDQSLIRHSSRFPAGLRVVVVPHTHFRGGDFTDEQVLAMLIRGDAWFVEERK